MKKKYELLLIISSFLILITASILSLFMTPTEGTILPYPQYTVPFFNFLCAALCLSLLFFKNKNLIEYLILAIQSFSTTITGYETLGAFLFTAFFLLLFCNGFFKTKLKRKIFSLMLAWFIICLSVLAFGIYRFILQIVTTLFFFSFFVFIYNKLSNHLSIFLPTKISTSVVLPKPGEELILSNYGLTERQVSMVKDYLEKQSSYTQLGNKYNISPSTVKKDMQKVFTLLGVRDLKNLHILLLQYIVK